MRPIGRARAVLVFGATLVAAAGARAQTPAPNPEVERHVAAGRAAAGTEHAVLFDLLCKPVAPGIAAAAPRPAGASSPANPLRAAPPADPPRNSWHAEPAKVFDNFYFLGMTDYTSWAIPTSAGIIVTDPLFDYSVEDEVVQGLTKLGMKPADIKYVLISHGHLDHAGGARLLQERYGARVLMSAADWNMVEHDNPRWKPKRDLEITDGQKLTLGDTTLTLYLTPGHTPGTVSTIIPLREGADRHVAALWGGTAFNFGPDKPRIQAYAASAARFRDIAAAAGADVLLSNHSDYDGTKVKLPALARRAAGAPNPYVVGADTVRRYLTVANECAQAAVAGLP